MYVCVCGGVGGTPGSRDEQQNFHYNDDDDDEAIRHTATTCFNIATDRINLFVVVVVVSLKNEYRNH